MLLLSDVNSLRTWSILSSVLLTRSLSDRIHSTFPSSSLCTLAWVVSFFLISRRRNHVMMANSAVNAAPTAVATQANTVGNSNETDVASIQLTIPPSDTPQPRVPSRQ